MVSPIHSPILPGNLTQQVQIIVGCDLILGVPVTDKAGVPYPAADVGNVWFGTADREGDFGPQARLGDGVELDDTTTQGETLAIVTIPSSITRNVAPGEYRFLIAASIGGQTVALAGGLLQVASSPVDWVALPP